MGKLYVNSVGNMKFLVFESDMYEDKLKRYLIYLNYFRVSLRVLAE